MTGCDAGSAIAFSTEMNGRRLTFRCEEGRIVDLKTGSAWNLVDQAVDGKLAGQQLKPMVGVNRFSFSWAAFKPETRIFQP